MATNPMDAPSPTAAATVEHDTHTHPGAGIYVTIGAILTAITAVEVGVYYMAALRPVMVPVLLTLSAAKFILVIMFYMHLKFDSRLFSTVFVGPLLLAVTVVISLFILFKVLPHYLVL